MKPEPGPRSSCCRPEFDLHATAMRPLFEALAPEFRVSTVDWPGFGNLVRRRTDWSPAILSEFLDWFLSEIVAPPHIVVAAVTPPLMPCSKLPIGATRSNGSF